MECDREGDEKRGSESPADNILAKIKCHARKKIEWPTGSRVLVLCAQPAHSGTYEYTIAYLYGKFDQAKDVHEIIRIWSNNPIDSWHDAALNMTHSDTLRLEPDGLKGMIQFIMQMHHDREGLCQLSTWFNWDNRTSKKLIVPGITISHPRGPYPVPVSTLMEVPPKIRYDVECLYRIFVGTLYMS